MIKAYVKFVVSVSLLLISTSYCFSQINLVTNGGFETVSPCPNNQGQLNYASPWVSARGTCDLYNTCGGTDYKIPHNLMGTQAARTGNGYAGFFATQGYFETREYLHAQLSAPLVAGKQYCVTFYVVLADTTDSFGDLLYDVGVNDVGAYIGSTAIAPAPYNLNHIAVTPQVVNNSSVQKLTDKNNWMQISGQYTAVGGEQYITIGSFSTQANQDTTWLDTWNFNNWAYYLVDDVSLIDCSAPSAPTLNVTANTAICTGATTTLTATATGGTAPYTYSWDHGLQPNSTQTVSPTTTTTYSVTVTDANMLTATSQVTVTVNPIPVVAVNSPIICTGTSATLTATGGTTYTWSTGAGTNPLIVSPTTITTYTVTGTTAGCSNTAIATVVVNSVPPTAVSSATICEGESVTLTATGASAYSWNTGASSNTVIVSPTSSITYTVTGISNGCAASATATVTVTPTPFVYAGQDDSNCPDSVTVLTAAGSGNLLWSNGSTASSISVSATTTTFYWVSLTSGGCTGKDSVTVFIKDSCIVETPITIFIPNIFSPNGDKINDLFEIKVEGMKNLSGEIVNRWGNTIAELSISNLIWTGKTTNGDDAPEGVYYLILKATDYKDGIHTEKGFIQLTR